MFEDKKSIAFVEQSFARGLDVVCLSIVQTQGSTYQKAGTTMFVNSAHEMMGVLSGGCIEEALLQCCDEVLSKRHGKIVTHDLRLADDSKQSWEEGVGCNGMISVWLEPFFHDEQYGALYEVLLRSKQGLKTTLVYRLGASAVAQATASSLAFDNDVKTLHLPVLPSLRLLIVGIGSAVQAMVDMANILGWTTLVCDTRAHELSLIQGSDKTLALSDAHDFEKLLERESFDACAIMSHQFKNDLAYMHASLASHTPYIGLLGSKERTRKLVEFLGTNAMIDERFHAPIGLSIGAKSPQAIALSICAQIESLRER